MKKSLIALAVLAASGASFAQSNFTLYGQLDQSFQVTRTEDATGSITKNSIGGGGVITNLWGLKGSEDLGGGLKANFNLEQEFAADTGAAGVTTNYQGVKSTTPAAFSRQAWVGFSGGFGAVRVGLTNTAYDDVSGASDPVWDSGLAPFANIGVSNNTYYGRPANTVVYQAPTFSGFSGAISYSLGEDKSLTPALSASSVTSVNLTYAAGPLGVQFGYQTEDKNTATNDKKFTRLGATYDFGVVKALATYGKAANIGNVDGADATDYQLGFYYPVSSALTLSASYAHTSYNVTAGDKSAKGYGIGAAYALSKRTTLYTGYESDTTSAPSVVDVKHSVFAAGVTHAF